MTHPESRAKALFVDFDGTIVTTDTAQIALDRFGESNWMRFDEAFERGEVSFEESLRRGYATLRAPPEAIIQEVSPFTALRPHFDRLIEYCRGNDVPFTVVSGGLDFVIRHFLDRDDWLKFVKVCAPASHFTGSGYTMTFPDVVSDGAKNFKDGLVRVEQSKGTRVFFVGNGYGDLSAAEEASCTFAIRGSRLAELCKEHNIEHIEIDDFAQVIDTLRIATGS